MQHPPPPGGIPLACFFQNLVMRRTLSSLCATRVNDEEFRGPPAFILGDGLRDPQISKLWVGTKKLYH